MSPGQQQPAAPASCHSGGWKRRQKRRERGRGAAATGGTCRRPRGEKGKPLAEKTPPARAVLSGDCEEGELTAAVTARVAGRERRRRGAGRVAIGGKQGQGRETAAARKSGGTASTLSAERAHCPLSPKREAARIGRTCLHQAGWLAPGGVASAAQGGQHLAGRRHEPRHPFDACALLSRTPSHSGSWSGGQGAGRRAAEGAGITRTRAKAAEAQLYRHCSKK